MIHAVVDNIIIIILTIISLFTSNALTFFVMAAGLLMVIITYEAFNDDWSMALSVLEFIVMILFALLSGGFAGFVVFSLFKAVKEYVRILFGVCLYVFTALVLYKNMSFAMCIVKTLLLIAAFLCMILIKYMMERTEKGCWSGKQSAETFTTVWDIP